MALIQDLSGSSNIRSDRQIIDMARTIAFLEPDAFPLLSLTRRLSKAVSISYEFKALEMDAQARRSTMTANATNTATTLAVADGTIFIAGDVVEATGTHEKVEVSSVTGNVLTVGRSVGTTAAQAIPSGAELLIIGNAHAQGAALGSVRTQQTDLFTNYLQIFRKPYGVTGSLAAFNLYGGDELNVKARQQGIIHAQDIERGFLFGERGSDTTGTHPKYYTGGVNSFITTNREDMGGSLTEGKFEAFLVDAFRYGSEQKLLLVSAKVLGVINSWARGKVRVAPSAKKYGMNLKSYESGQGTVTLIKHKLLEGDEYQGYAFLLDMKDLKYRFARGRDTHIRVDVGTPGDDARTDEYLTECGLQMTLEKNHGVLTNAAS